VRDYTKNGQTRRLKLDRAVVELVRGQVAEHGIGSTEVIFPADLYAHGTMGGIRERSAGARRAVSGKTRLSVGQPVPCM
jgi:hypothetical protein